MSTHNTHTHSVEITQTKVTRLSENTGILNMYNEVLILYVEFTVDVIDFFLPSTNH